MLFPASELPIEFSFPVNRELKRRVPIECSNRSKMQELGVSKTKT